MRFLGIQPVFNEQPFGYVKAVVLGVPVKPVLVFHAALSGIQKAAKRERPVLEYNLLHDRIFNVRFLHFVQRDGGCFVQHQMHPVLHFKNESAMKRQQIRILAQIFYNGNGYCALLRFGVFRHNCGV